MNDIVESGDELPPAPVPTIRTSTSALVLDAHNLDQMERLANIMASGRATIPKHFMGSPGDCMAVVMQAVSWGMNPYAVAQKTHVVNGQLGYEAQLVNAVITSSSVIEGRPEYEWFGPWDKVIGKFTIMKGKAKEDDKRETEYRIPGWTLKDEEGIGIKVRATIKGEAAPRELTLLLAQARVRNSPLWADDPRQQLAYLALKRWSRLYTPDVIMGVYSPDELDQSQPMKDLNGAPPRNAKPATVAAAKRAQQEGPSETMLFNARAEADRGTKAFAAFWKLLKPAQRGSLREEVPDLEQRCKHADASTIDAGHKPAATPEDSDFVRQMDAHENSKGGK